MSRRSPSHPSEPEDMEEGNWGFGKSPKSPPTEEGPAPSTVIATALAIKEETKPDPPPKTPRTPAQEAQALATLKQQRERSRAARAEKEQSKWGTAEEREQSRAEILALACKEELKEPVDNQPKPQGKD